MLLREEGDAVVCIGQASPALNPATGRPQSFMEMPLHVHLGLWSAAPQRLFTQSRYAALLVSLHGTALYERRDLERLDDSDADAVRGYLAGQRALQQRLAQDVGASDEELLRNQRLLWTWDWLSLALCLDWEIGRDVLDPWPLRDERVEVRCEGRRLEGRFADERELHRALEAAPRVDLRFVLTPSGAGAR